MKMNFTTKWEKRLCPICGESDDFFLLGQRTYQLPANPHTYTFEMEDVICNHCSFVFTLKVPIESFINDYYCSTSIKVALNYNKKRRLHLIKKLMSRGSSILEVGPGYEGLRYLIGKNYDIDALYVGDDLPKKKYDLITAYYVLEHITHPRLFIHRIRPLIKDGGYIIIEVPDFEKYPKEAFFVEHFNYFTKRHLEALLITEGFDIIKVINAHSRYFGFTIVARAIPSVIESIKEEYVCI